MISPGLRAGQERCGQAEVEDAMDYLLSPEQDASEIRVRLQPLSTPDEDSAIL